MGRGHRGFMDEEAFANQVDRMRRRVESGNVEFADVLKLTHWSTLEDVSDPRRNLGVEFQDEVRSLFKQAHGGDATRLAVFRYSGMAVYLTPAGSFQFAILREALCFDSSEARTMIYEIDSMAEQAREWWPPKRKSGGPRKELQPHLDRAYMLMTGVMGGVDDEAARVRGLAAGAGDSADNASRYATSLSVLRPELQRSRQLLDQWGDRLAKVRYGLGMLVGVGIIAALCVILAVAFSIADLPAVYGVAVPAGALGAVVSVLQRMTSNSLQLDVNTGPQILAAYGAVRPVVGAILGMAVFALLEGGLLPAIDIDDHSELAFYAAVGFLAGFNERFAQDMLARARPDATT
jgi:hypothetical protein